MVKKMKLTFLAILSLFILSVYADNDEIFNNKTKFNSFNSLENSYISNKTIILKGSEYGFEEARIITGPTYKVKKEKRKIIPGIKNYNLSFLDKNLNTLYQVHIADPFNYYSHDSDGRRMIGLKKNPYLEIPIPEEMDIVSVKIERIGKDKFTLVNRFNLIK